MINKYLSNKWIWLIMALLIVIFLYIKLNLYLNIILYFTFLFFIPFSLIIFFFQTTERGKKRNILYALIIGIFLGILLIAIQFPAGFIALIIDTLFSYLSQTLSFEEIWGNVLIFIMPYSIILVMFITYRYLKRK